MTTGTISQSSLLTIADTIYPPAGTIGHAILLKPDLASMGVTANATTGVFTTASAHGLVTGSRVRIASTATVPTPLSATTDYYAIVASATTLRLAATLADAIAASAIALTDAGTGTLTLNERPLTSDDPVSVLVNKELAGSSGYARLPLAGVGAATLVGGIARKSPIVTLNNTGATSIEFISILVALGANNTIGSASGVTSYWLVTETSTVATAPGQTRAITIDLEVES